MGKVSMVAGLVLVLGLLAFGQTPEVTCWRVNETTAGSFIVQIPNTWTKAAKELIIIFNEPVILSKGLGFGKGGTEPTISGEGRVWYVRFPTVLAPASALEPSGWALLAFSTVTPVKVDGCKFIRKAVPIG